MKTFRIFALIAITTIVGSAFASGDPLRTINACHDAFTKAALANDGAATKKAAMDYFDKSFKYSMPSMKLKQGREDWINGIVQYMAMGKTTIFKFKLGKVAMKGNNAWVTSTLSMTTIGKGSDGKESKTESTSVNKEVWQKMGAAWKMTEMTEVSGKMKVNGKEVKMPG